MVANSSVFVRFRQIDRSITRLRKQRQTDLSRRQVEIERVIVKINACCQDWPDIFLHVYFCTLMNFQPVHGQPLNAVHFHKIFFLITHMSTKRFQGATNISSNNRENLLLSLLSPKTLLIVPVVYWPNSTRLIQLICCRCCAGLASSMKLSLRQWWFIQWSATHLTALYVLPSSVQFMLSSSISSSEFLCPWRTRRISLV